MKKPNPNEIYRHFKGNLYRIITLAVHSETQEEMVVYQGLYGDLPVYVRPLDMFIGPVDRKKYPDAEQALRFELVEELIGQGGVNLQENAMHQEDALHREAQKDRMAGSQKDLASESQEKIMHRAEDVLSHKPGESESAASDAVGAEDAPRREPQKEQRLSQKEQELQQEDQELPLDPLVLEFLDADTYEERLNILVALHPRITDDMINTMAMVIDVEVKDGDIEERYAELKFCLLTKEKYERTRLT